MLWIILDAESERISVTLGPLPAEAVLLPCQQLWRCDPFSLFGVFGSLCSVSHKPQLGVV